VFVPVQAAACTGTFSHPPAPVTDTGAESDAAAHGLAACLEKNLE